MTTNPDDILDDELRHDIELNAKRCGQSSRQYLRELVAGARIRPDPEAGPEVIAKQQRALNRFFADLDALPDRNPDDGLRPSRDHDRILYGGK